MNSKAIDADELKLLAQVLTEKYAEFDVQGRSRRSIRAR